MNGRARLERDPSRLTSVDRNEMNNETGRISPLNHIPCKIKRQLHRESANTFRRESLDASMEKRETSIVPPSDRRPRGYAIFIRMSIRTTARDDSGHNQRSADQLRARMNNTKLATINVEN